MRQGFLGGQSRISEGPWTVVVEDNVEGAGPRGPPLQALSSEGLGEGLVPGVRWWEPGGAADAGGHWRVAERQEEVQGCAEGTAERGEAGERGLATVVRIPV